MPGEDVLMNAASVNKTPEKNWGLVIIHEKLGKIEVLNLSEEKAMQFNNALDEAVKDEVVVFSLLGEYDEDDGEEVDFMLRIDSQVITPRQRDYTFTTVGILSWRIFSLSN